MMKKALIWNIRSVRTQQAFKRLQMLNRHHQFLIIGLMEPLQHSRNIQTYRRKLNMRLTGSNMNGKIWYFVKENVEVEIILDTEQQITLKLSMEEENLQFVTTLVYANYDRTERLQLWDSIYQLAKTMALPWLVGGDFNTVLSDEEKIGGLPVTSENCEEFAFCINFLELLDVGFKGSPFTWWNGRTNSSCIFERLDRVVVNQQLQDKYGLMKVEHLSRTGSDHAPLFIGMGEQNNEVKNLSGF